MKGGLTMKQYETSVGRIGLSLFKYILAIILFIFTTSPFFWIISCSLKGTTEIMATPPTLIPKQITFVNYINAVKMNSLLTYLLNSLVVTVFSVLGTIFIAALAAYAIGFFKFKAGKLYERLLIMVQLLPVVIALVPLFIIFNKMGIQNTRLSLILAYTASTWGLPIAVILITGFFTEIPKALQESAWMDGCSVMGIFFKIILPLSIPGLIAASINIFIAVWQEFTLAVSLLSDKKLYTLPVGLTDFVGMHGTDWGGLMATSVVIALPSIILFVCVQKYFIDGMSGAVKG
jgi:ABC-type glycerol-3-phosphate transport system permease component